MSRSHLRVGRLLAGALVGLAALFTLVGCATVAPQPFPFTGKSVSVNLAPPVVGALPLGSYVDADKRLVVREKQTGVAAAGITGLLLLGPGAADLAAQAAYRSNARATEKRYAPVLAGAGIDGSNVSRMAFADALAGGAWPGWSAGGNAQVTLSPVCFFRVGENGQAHLWAWVTLDVPDATGRSTWQCSSRVEAAGAYPLDAKDGWFTGTRFADSAGPALRRAMELCIDLATDKLKPGARAKLTGPFPETDAPATFVFAEASSTPEEFVGLQGRMILAVQRKDFTSVPVVEKP